MRDRADLFKRARNVVFGNGVEVKRLPLVFDERAVLAYKDALVGDGREQLCEVGVLSAASGKKKNAAAAVGTT